MSLEKVQNVYTTTKTDISSTYTIGIGNELTYYKLYPSNDINYSNSSLSHLWTYVGVTDETQYNLKNQLYNNGGLLNTSFEKILDAWSTTGGVGIVVNNDNYRTQVYGQNIAIKIPLNSAYTGMTSGLTAVTLYSSFIYSPDNLNKNPYSLCSGVRVDGFRSEPNYGTTGYIPMGWKYLPGKNPDVSPESEYKEFDSGIVFLVTDSVTNTFTGSTGSSISWGHLWNQENKYSKGARTINWNLGSTQIPNFYDRVVGAVFLNSGFVFIWEPEITQAIDWSTINGDPTSLTGGTFTSGQTFFNGADLDMASVINVKIVADGSTWKASTNPTYIGTGKDCGIAMTTINLYDQNGECLAVVKPNESMVKEDGQYMIFDLSLPISGDIQESKADTVGLIVTP
jgi:hypothetical protein